MDLIPANQVFFLRVTVVSSSGRLRLRDRMIPSNHNSRNLLCCLLLLAGFCPGASAQNLAEERTKLFSENCGSCHGLDGRGGERGPDVASSRDVQKLSDSALGKIVREGIPGSGMPPFSSLGDANIRALVAELRTLQGHNSTSPLPGSPEAGKTLFSGGARCAECHMANGVGGFMGSDLSAYARNRTAAEIRDAIIHPSGHSRHPLVVATTQDGQTFTGLARNEDNFSLQLQTSDGAFHFFDKSALRGLEHPSQSLMPSDYETRLSQKQIDDIISYLMVLSRSSHETGNPAERKLDDEAQEPLE
jgi:cytochrome c oxidase cbb3-type subunit III